MPRPPIDLNRKIKDILLHTEPLPYEAKSPILHYRRTGTDIWNALGYVDTARVCNKRVGERLAELLTLIHTDSPGVLVTADFANRISTSFQLPLRVDVATGIVV